MSVDDRLRQGLGVNAAAFEPRVEAGLEGVRRRGRRAGRARLAVAAVLVAAASAFVTVAVRSGEPQDRPSAPSVVTPPSTADLFGRYEADVARPARLAGRWDLELRGNGSALVVPPDGYAGVVSGTIFTADRKRLRINLFAQDVCAGRGDGEYAWTREGDRLVLEVVEDACAARTRFFSGTDWVQVPPS